MLAVGIELVTLNFLWALSRSQQLLNSGLAAKNPEAYNVLESSVGPAKTMAFIFGAIALVGILVWHLMRKKRNVNLWTGMFYVLIYAIVTVLLLIGIISSGAFNILRT
jgi:hypothetical protein